MTDWFGLLDGMTGIVRDTFGEPFSYTRAETGETLTHSAATGEPLIAPFDPSHEPLESGASLTVAGRIAVIEVKISDLGFEPAKRDGVNVAGRDWKVHERYASSSGMMKLHLRKE